jgi:hypothetical protein
MERPAPERNVPAPSAIPAEPVPPPESEISDEDIPF